MAPTQSKDNRATVHSAIVTARDARLAADLVIPANAHGAVLFAHGSGSSRFSARNRHVAEILQDAGFATVLLDLLTPQEERVDAVTRALRFDIPLLARRLADATDWVSDYEPLRGFGIGYFGASTGAAAALIAAAERPAIAEAVVSRGGRPDLAGDLLPLVRAPTLLIVGSLDRDVLALNVAARKSLGGLSELSVVPNATHLFEEPGALDQVARLATDWFVRYV